MSPDTTWTVPGYTEVRELGRGGSGRVILSTHEATGTPVAIKYLDDELRTDETYLREFRAEARLIAEVDSPNVARLYEYVESDAGAAIVMELVNGVSLRAMLREHGPTEPEAALCVLKGSLLGLAAAHAHNVVHRDYKPENVLVDGVGSSKLADFGIAVRVGRTAVVAGTPAYMAPEQWAGGPASPGTDIYAATVTFYECLTGKRPYQGDLNALRRQHEQAPIPLEDAPPVLHGLLRSGLAKEPGRRPANALAFLADLESAARFGYGEDWESRGRGKLAQRAALLAALWPLAGSVVGGSALATTVLGASKLKKLIVGTGIAVVVGTGGVASCIALTPPPASGGPVAIGTPISTFPATPTVTSSPSASTSPTPPTSISPTPPKTSTTTKPPPPPPPVPPPPPPATKVTAITARIAISDGRARATIGVKTTGTGKITIFVKFYGQSGIGRNPPEEEVMNYSVPLSGKTSYSLIVPSSGYPLPLAKCRAGTYYIKARVTSNPAGPTAQSQLQC